MINYSSELVVNRPLTEVFSFMNTVANFDRWTDMSETRLVSGNGIALGSQIQTRLKVGFFRRTMVFEVVAFEPNRKIEWKTTNKGPLDLHAEYLFESVDGSATRVIGSGVIRLNGAWKLLEGMMAGEVRKSEANELVKFKRLVEARG